MAADKDDMTREVTVSTNRQIGLPSEFARRMGVGPGSRLLETLIRLPGGSYAVLLMPRPASYSAMLADALAVSGKGGLAFLRELRNEWEDDKPKKRRRAAQRR